MLPHWRAAAVASDVTLMGRGVTFFERSGVSASSSTVQLMALNSSWAPAW